MVVHTWKFSTLLLYILRDNWSIFMILGSNEHLQQQLECTLFKTGQWHFHQDNTPVHNPILVTDCLTKMGIKTVPHPHYSSEFAPCKFWLFPKLRGCRYEIIEEMKETVTKVIDTLTQEGFRGAFQKLLERYNKCIAARGDDFEEGLEFHVCTINKNAHSKKVSKLI